MESQAQTAPWSRRAFENEIGNPNSQFLVGLSGGEVVAYGGIWTVVDEAHVTTVMVAPESRRSGIGRALMVNLLETAQKLGMTCSTLEVRVSNEAAIQLYENLGYVRVATRKKYYPDNQEDAVIMWLYDLDQWQA